MPRGCSWNIEMAIFFSFLLLIWWLQTLDFLHFPAESQVIQLAAFFFFKYEELDPKVKALTRALIMSYGSQRPHRQRASMLRMKVRRTDVGAWGCRGDTLGFILSSLVITQNQNSLRGRGSCEAGLCCLMPSVFCPTDRSPGSWSSPADREA